MADDPLASLRARFRDRCAEDAASVRAYLAGRTDVELEQRVHRLAGAAGMFGHAELGGLALEIDAVLATGEPPTTEALRDLAEALEQSLRVL